ncbi:MAG TPA: DUF4215 domain-containing protein, partial [Nannocystis sp.]
MTRTRETLSVPPTRALLLVLSLAACADDGAAAATSTDAQGSTGSTGSTSSTTSTSVVTGTSSGEAPPTSGDMTSTGVAGTSTGEPGFDPPRPACGNGYLEAMEECDDGNLVDGDGCNAACQTPCGLELELLELAPTAESTISG